MSKELDALNILRDNHIQYTKEKYRRLTNPSKIQNIINLKLAQWDILEQALKRNEPIKLKTKRVKVSIDDYRIDDYCPTCDEELYATSNYCPNCGQKLDWSDDEMNSYTFIGTEQDLLDNDFTYRPHYDNYFRGYYKENYETCQNLFIQIDSKTKEVSIFIQTINGHRNKTYFEKGLYLIQADIYPIYFKVINELIEKNIIKEKENERNII